jgi:hypothetical protein
VANFNVVLNGGVSQCGDYSDMRDVTLTYNATNGEVFYVLVDSYGGNRCDVTLSVKGPICNVALPVKLLNFNVIRNGDKAIIKWSTTSEINASRFIIEKATPVINSTSLQFNEIGEVLVYNSAKTQSYQYLDDISKDKPTKIYYRLNLVDLNGNAENLVTADLQKREDALKILSIGNDAEGINLEYRIDIASNIYFNLYNDLGQLLMTEKLDQGEYGYQKKKINISALHPGFYFYQITSDKIEKSGKFIK